jgi:peptidylprolyl isomerase/FKBP-type peptidyl-prolyl cis-trans isomerase SlyD
MQNNDFIILRYSGKLKETGQEFDKSEDTPVIIGAEYAIKGVEEALKEMNPGEKKTIEIPPEKGFGERNQKLIKLVPISEFRRQDKKPIPGMMVSIKDMRGRILSVSGGRVKIDFNHPLSGKTLIYELEIKEKIEKIEDKIKMIINIYTRIEKDKIDIKMNDKEVEIVLPPLISPVYKKKIADECIKFLGLERVKFVELFEKQKE